MDRWAGCPPIGLGGEGGVIQKKKNNVGGGEAQADLYNRGTIICNAVRVGQLSHSSQSGASASWRPSHAVDGMPHTKSFPGR